MKFKIVIVIFLSFNYVNAFCSDSIVLGKYYNYIYAAEENILQSDYIKAGSYYDSAFSLKKNIPFAADIYNNMLVGINCADNKKIFKMGKMLILKGVDISFFNKVIFTKFRTTTDWSELNKIYKSLKIQREKTIDRNLIAEIERLIEADQRFAHIHEENRRNVTPGVFNPESENLFLKEEDSLDNILIDLMKNNDYLSEEKIGIVTSDTLISFSPQYNVLMIHSFQIRDSALLYASLQESIHRGKIKSGQAMNYFSLMNTNFSSLIKINYLNRYYLFKDTIYKRIMPLESAKCHVIDLLSDNPNKEEEEMINYFYIDKPNFILNKLKYFCKIISYYKKGKSLEQNMLFFFGPTIISTTTRSDLFKDDKIIFVCQY